MASECEGRQWIGTVERELGDEAADRRCELEAVAREAAREHDVGLLRMAVDGEVPRRRGAVEADAMARDLAVRSREVEVHEVFERAAIAALVPHLDPGQASVGSIVRVTHRAPTPLGDSVRAVARVRSVDGAQVWFDLEARDGSEPIGDGEHLRVVIDEDRFNRRVARKAEGATR